MKKIFNKNVKIALTVLAALCLLFWGIEYLKGINMFKPANYYYADFENVDGLLEAAPISVNGFQVGQVREIKYDYGKNSIKVLLSMNKGLQIPEGSSVSMTKGLMGGASLVLNMGDASNGILPVGSNLPVSSIPGLLDKVQTEVLPQVDNILPKVDSIMGNVNGLTGDPALAASLARLDAITTQLARSAQQLNTLMVSLNRAVPGVMNDVNGITTNLTGATGNLTDLSVSLKQMPLDSTINMLNATLANLQAVSKQLGDKNSSLGKLMNDDGLYNSANHAIASLDSLINDIKANPKRYINVKVF